MAKTNLPIIDVDPVAHARGFAQAAGAAAQSAAGAAQAAASAATAPFRAPSYGKSRVKVANEPLHTTYIDDKPTGPGAPGQSRAVGVAQTAAGAALVAVGIPMLILPGPGLLAIGGGAALAASGISKVRRKKER